MASTSTARAKPRGDAAEHHLRSTPETVHWGFYDANIKPALTVRSGDRVRIDCVSGSPAAVPKPEQGFHVPPELLDIHARAPKGTGNHILTGPIYVEDAAPGDVLEVRIHEIALRQDWGYNIFRPLGGTLPDDFPYGRMIHIRLDRDAMTAELPWGMKLPLRPFFGQLAVAPRPVFGRQNSKEPREFGGNLDCKELVAGSTIYLPVWTEGALFSTGDGHGCQGDGEVDGTAIETALSGLFEFTVRKDMSLRVPQAESPTHYITMGLDVDLDDAAKMALREMVMFLSERLGISRDHAYALSSLAVDLHVTQTVNNVRGVHAMIDKTLLG